MKEMIRKMREENKGFTLAELLIVVAIVMVLVAIAIPVFTSSLHNSQEATDEANCRSLYGELQADYLANINDSHYTGDSTPTAAKDGATVSGSTITFSDGEKAELSVSSCTATFHPGEGWSVTWVCNDHSGNTQTWGIQ